MASFQECSMDTLRYRICENTNTWAAGNDSGIISILYICDEIYKGLYITTGEEGLDHIVE